MSVPGSSPCPPPSGVFHLHFRLVLLDSTCFCLPDRDESWRRVDSQWSMKPPCHGGVQLQYSERLSPPAASG